MADVSFALVEGIVKSLPIGYYAKRNVYVECDKKVECSFYDPLRDSITISYLQIARGLKNSKQTTESTIRAMVYHELSHAIATPRELEMNDIINVFEDERIETLFAGYYMDVDFKQNVREINNWDGITKADPNDPFSVFYHAIRYRDTTSKINEKIEKQLSISLDSDIWHIEHSASYLWELITGEKYHPEKYSSPSLQEIQGEGKERGIKSDGELKNGKRKNPFDFKGLSIQRDESFTQSVAILFENFNKKCGGSAVQTYSGVFNPRNVARNDYRYFDRIARNVGNNKFGAIHLNLFLDCSGSFAQNETATNQVLKALAEMETQYKFFDFTVIACAIGQKILDKSSRVIKCGGGTQLTSDIFSQFRQVQKQNCMNYNIVMYDGDAAPVGKSFSAFSKPNCFIISEEQNKRYINRDVKNAKVVYSENYVDELKDNVLKALQLALS